MENIFEVVDKTGRKIRLTKKQWSHITKGHKYMVNYLEDIEKALIRPIRIFGYIKKI